MQSGKFKPLTTYLPHFLLILFLLTLTGCATPQPAIAIPASPPPVAKMKSPPRVALVLGSGGSRGYAHLGVLQALEEAHIPVDVIVGSSAGSIVGALYADNQSFQKTYDIMMPAGFWDYADIANFTEPGGLIKGYQLENFLLKNMQVHSFKHLQKKLIVAATDLQTGKLYSIESGPIAPAVLASSAIPGAIKPVKLYGHVLVDGGVVNPVPVELAKKLHPKLVIAVTLSQRKPQKEIPSTALGVLDSAIFLMDKRLTEFSVKGADVVINPEVGDVNFLDLRNKREMYLAGLSATRKKIPLIRKLLGYTS